MKNIVIAVLALLVLALIAITLMREPSTTVENTIVSDNDATETIPEADISEETEAPADTELAREPVEVIGTSGDGADITAHHFGTGDETVLFIGGIHSGFAPGTVAVAEELITALKDGDIAVPADLTVTVIPNMNPDAERAPNALAGRLNANGVDLNRNFDCQWSADGTWRDQAVSGGGAVFSEAEAKTVRDFVTGNNIVGAVAWYAADGGVYTSSCGGADTLPETTALVNAFATAAGYAANADFDSYAITGDMMNWLAKRDVPAISVLLTDYTNPEWSKNQAGVEAVLEYFAE